MRIEVLRLGHRPVRDKRLTTHLFLAARALGASGGYYSGVPDKGIEKGMRDVCLNWGGSFAIGHTTKWKAVVQRCRESGSEIIHLTMYGTPIQLAIEKLRESPKDKLIIVGGEKVPKDLYQLSDWNLAVTSQPHSEVSALAILLHELHRGRELEKTFDGSRLVVIPQEHGKRVIRAKEA